jgi:hypothetical protein
MVNNSTNINKTNNQLSFKLKPLSTKKTTTYGIGNPGPDLGQAGLNLLLEDRSLCKLFWPHRNVSSTFVLEVW